MYNIVQLEINRHMHIAVYIKKESQFVLNYNNY